MFAAAFSRLKANPRRPWETFIDVTLGDLRRHSSSEGRATVDRQVEHVTSRQTTCPVLSRTAWSAEKELKSSFVPLCF